MTTNITTLALNLLISERLDQRNNFANQIVTQLEENGIDSENEKAMKVDFLMVIEQCIENPNSEARDIFYQLALYFTNKAKASRTISFLQLNNKGIIKKPQHFFRCCGFFISKCSLPTVIDKRQVVY
jgi:hypothetical protein